MSKKPVARKQKPAFPPKINTRGVRLKYDFAAIHDMTIDRHGRKSEGAKS